MNFFLLLRQQERLIPLADSVRNSLNIHGLDFLPTLLPQPFSQRSGFLENRSVLFSRVFDLNIPATTTTLAPFSLFLRVRFAAAVLPMQPSEQLVGEKRYGEGVVA